MSVQGTTTVNFGAGATDALVSISAPTILGSQLVDAWLMPKSTATNTVDDHWVEKLSVTAGNVVDATGFTIYAQAIEGLAHGQFTVAYVFN